MRTTAVVMGIVGSVFGVMSALIVLTGAVVGKDPALNEMALRVFLLSLAGLLGGAMSRSHPKVGAAAMGLTALGLLFSVSFLATLSIILFLLGAAFAVIARTPESPVRDRVTSF